jgi:hypothetical protein
MKYRSRFAMVAANRRAPNGTAAMLKVPIQDVEVADPDNFGDND